ncbi:hypothetical protein PR048_025827 [Dryococelus australis]|uniref:Uncharacterized protein n=1 Tax=Dryococelus australis TaxID=614101 RepID=A0ABQ9GJM7_9NEOP|nr:hypothetical protein PR048_025827 [Dryococelus australis]
MLVDTLAFLRRGTLRPVPFPRYLPQVRNETSCLTGEFGKGKIPAPRGAVYRRGNPLLSPFSPPSLAADNDNVSALVGGGGGVAVLGTRPFVVREYVYVDALGRLDVYFTSPTSLHTIIWGIAFEVLFPTFSVYSRLRDEKGGSVDGDDLGNYRKVKFAGRNLCGDVYCGVDRIGRLSAARSREPIRVRRGECGAAPACEVGRSGRSPRKSVDQWHRPERPRRESNLTRLCGRCLFIGCCPIEQSVLLHTWQYGTRYLFPCKSDIVSESSRSCLINCDPIAKSTSVHTCLTSIFYNNETSCLLQTESTGCKTRETTGDPDKYINETLGWGGGEVREYPEKTPAASGKGSARFPHAKTRIALVGGECASHCATAALFITYKLVLPRPLYYPERAQTTWCEQCHAWGVIKPGDYEREVRRTLGRDVITELFILCHTTMYEARRSTSCVRVRARARDHTRPWFRGDPQARLLKQREHVPNSCTIVRDNLRSPLARLGGHVFGGQFNRGRGGAMVRLLVSHPDEPGQIPGVVSSRFSCRTMPLIDGFSRGYPVFPDLAFWR